MAKERPVTLSVFMEGTSNPMNPITTQIALFARCCDAETLDGKSFEAPPRKSGHYKLCFDGCGVTNGFWGVVLAVGVQEQCQLTRRYVESFLEAGLTVTINFVGLSRGGIGGLYLAKELAHLDRDKILLNLLLYDPVPGDFVWISRYLDLMQRSNANRTMNVSNVRNLGRVVVLYPHEPLPSIAVHAPLIPEFPQDCEVEWDVLLGCHQGALFVRSSPDTYLSFALIRDFLRDLGSRINVSGHELDLKDAILADVLKRELNRFSPTTSRFAHSASGSWDIVRRDKGQFLCRTHQKLLRRLGQPCETSPNSSIPEFMLDFQKS